MRRRAERLALALVAALAAMAAARRFGSRVIFMRVAQGCEVVGAKPLARLVGCSLVLATDTPYYFIVAILQGHERK